MQVVSDGSIDIVPSSPLQLPPNNNNNNNLKYGNSNINKILVLIDLYLMHFTNATSGALDVVTNSSGSTKCKLTCVGQHRHCCRLRRTS